MKPYFLALSLLLICAFALPGYAVAVSVEMGREPSKKTKKLTPKALKKAFKHYKKKTRRAAVKRASIQRRMNAPEQSNYNEVDIFGPIWLVGSLVAIITGLILLLFGFPILVMGSLLLSLGIIASLIWIIINF